MALSIEHVNISLTLSAVIEQFQSVWGDTTLPRRMVILKNQKIKQTMKLMLYRLNLLLIYDVAERHAVGKGVWTELTG